MKATVYPKQLNVNDKNLVTAIQEACNPMQSQFDPTHDSLPYFYNQMSGADKIPDAWGIPKKPGNYHHVDFSLSHVPGRFLNGLLHAEATIGIHIRENVIENLAKWTYRAIAHPMGLPQSLDLNTYEIIPICNLHNLRDTMHALYALVRFRLDERALHLAKRLIGNVNKYYNFLSGVWDEEGLQHDTNGRTNYSFSGIHPFPRYFGRYIGPLVKLYRACGVEEALIQAIQLKDFAFKEIINENGDYDVEKNGGHTHSTTAMLSSLAQLGEVLADCRILDRVGSFMKNGLKNIALDFGWCIENYFRKDHYGEINNTADILETCLILGKFGYAEYYQQAERILRAHLLPAQLLDTSFVSDDDVPMEDYHHKMATRSRGAFGFPCPYGHEYQIGSWISFNWDIVGGGVDGLCQAYRDKVTVRDSVISINMLFDHDDPNIEVKNPYENNDVLKIKLKRKNTLRVRMSDWVETRKIVVSIDGRVIAPLVLDGWLYLDNLQGNEMIAVQIPMKSYVEEYPFREDVFKVRWKGDSVIAMANFGKRLCYFEDL